MGVTVRDMVLGVRSRVEDDRSAGLLPELALGAGAVAGATALSSLVERFVSESDIIMIFVVAVTLAAHRMRLRSSLVTALASVLSFNFFFTHPQLTLYVHDTRYLFTFIALGGTGALISSLASHARERAQHSRELYRLTRRLAACESHDEVARIAVDQLYRLAGVPVTIWLVSPDGLELEASLGDPDVDEAERAAALACVDPGVADGGQAVARGRYLALTREGRVRGAIGVHPPTAGGLDGERDQILRTAADVISEVLDRLGLEAHARSEHLAAESERVRSTLLSSVSHDLRTPLATITGASTTLLDERARLDASMRRELLTRITDEAGRLERLVDNVLHMTRLDSSGVAPSLDWHVPQEVVGAAIARISPRGAGRPVTVTAPIEPTLTFMDAVLVEQGVANFLENALVHAPGSPVHVRVHAHDAEVCIEVEDQGPGLDDDDMATLFQKFARGRAAPRGGAGLGLAICHAIARVHGGRVWAGRGSTGGAVFGMALPRGGPTHEAAPDAEEPSSVSVA